MAWLALAGAIALEVTSTLCLKTSDGFSRLWPTIFVIFGYTGSFTCLGYALKSFDVGLVYAIWSAVGTAAIVIIGVAAFHEPISAVRIGGILLIVLGVVVLNLSESKHATQAPPTSHRQLSEPEGTARPADSAQILTSGPKIIDTRELRPNSIIAGSGVPWIPRQRSPYIESLSADRNPNTSDGSIRKTVENGKDR